MSRFDTEDLKNRDAEQGYSVRGEREVRMREWFSLREHGEGPRDFKRLVWALQQRRAWAKKAPERKARIFAYRKKWAKEHPETARDWKRRGRAAQAPWWQKQLARKREKFAEVSAKRRAVPWTCVVCGVQWCTVGRLPAGFKPKYCSQSCRGRAAYQRAKKAGKR